MRHQKHSRFISKTTSVFFLLVGLVSIIGVSNSYAGELQEADEPRVGVTRAAFGIGKKARVVTKGVQEVVKERKAVRILSRNLGTRGKKGSKRERLRINYVVNGWPGELQLEHGTKRNIYDEIVKHAAKEARKRNTAADKAAADFAQAFLMSDAKKLGQTARVPFLNFDGKEVHIWDEDDNVGGKLKSVLANYSLIDEPKFLVKRRLAPNDLPIESLGLDEANEKQLEQFLKPNDQVLYLQTKVTGQQPESFFAVIVRRFRGEPKVIGILK